MAPTRKPPTRGEVAKELNRLRATRPDLQRAADALGLQVVKWQAKVETLTRMVKRNDENLKGLRTAKVASLDEYKTLRARRLEHNVGLTLAKAELEGAEKRYDKAQRALDQSNENERALSKMMDGFGVVTPLEQRHG